MSFRQPTCALKLPSRTIDSTDVAFCKATLTSTKKGWYCASAFGRTPAKCTVTTPIA